MGFEPLSEASLRALQLPARFLLVVLAEAASLREFLALSIVLPYPMIRFNDHQHCTCPHRRLSLVLSPISSRMGFELLSDDSLRVL